MSSEKEESQGDLEDEDKINNEIRMHNITTKKEQDKKDLEDKPTTKSTLTYLGKKKENATKTEIRPENIRNNAFYYPKKIIKKISKIQFKLDFDSFKCSEVFGVSIGHMRQILDMKIYQILVIIRNIML
jgi:hypothetical protein